MKNYRICIAALLLFCTVAGCSESAPELEPEKRGEEGEGCSGNLYQQFYLRNLSGHVVSVVHKPACWQLPDSLVLKDGDIIAVYEGFVYDKNDFFRRNDVYDVRRIYYDSQYAIDHADLIDRRWFTNYMAFKMVVLDESKMRWVHVYTFSTDDYDYAVEHGRFLGEKP